MTGNWFGTLRPAVEVEQQSLPEHWQIADIVDPKCHRAAIALFEEMFEPLGLNGGAFDNAMDVASVLQEPETYPDWHIQIIQGFFAKLAGRPLVASHQRTVELVQAHLATHFVGSARSRVKKKMNGAMRG